MVLVPTARVSTVRAMKPVSASSHILKCAAPLRGDLQDVVVFAGHGLTAGPDDLGGMTFWVPECTHIPVRSVTCVFNCVPCFTDSHSTVWIHAPDMLPVVAVCTAEGTEVVPVHIAAAAQVFDTDPGSFQTTGHYRELAGDNGYVIPGLTPRGLFGALEQRVGVGSACAGQGNGRQRQSRRGYTLSPHGSFPFAA